MYYEFFKFKSINYCFQDHSCWNIVLWIWGLLQSSPYFIFRLNFRPKLLAYDNALWKRESSISMGTLEIYLATIYQAYLRHLLSGHGNHTFLNVKWCPFATSKVIDSSRPLVEINFNELHGSPAFDQQIWFSLICCQ